ncbi:hypothetical protein F8M41_014260 [Gigaspora margarita]|uniref:Uncharacterized protein n=1 Tax=Gigaspora margarita TaxID=4874 RepID=A0A8H3WYV5_GIGMA|nr:hypothetical protein F8M41_014260 [Gigaspora margarita]
MMSMALTESHIKTTFPTFKRERSLLIKLIKDENISYKTNNQTILDKIYNDLIQQTRELLDESFYKYIKEDNDKIITDSIVPEWIGLLACIEFIRARIFLKLLNDPSVTFEKLFTLTYSDDDGKIFIISIPGDESLPLENNVERKVIQNTVKIYMEFVIIAMSYLTNLREGKDFNKEKAAYYSFGDVLDGLHEPTSPSIREICLKYIINLIKTEITDIEVNEIGKERDKIRIGERLRIKEKKMIEKKDSISVSIKQQVGVVGLFLIGLLWVLQYNAIFNILKIIDNISYF